MTVKMNQAKICSVTVKARTGKGWEE